MNDVDTVTIVRFIAIIFLFGSSVRGIIASIKAIMSERVIIKQRKVFKPYRIMLLEGKNAKIHGIINIVADVFLIIGYSVLAFPTFYGGVNLVFLFFAIGAVLMICNIIFTKYAAKTMADKQKAKSKNR